MNGSMPILAIHDAVCRVGLALDDVGPSQAGVVDQALDAIANHAGLSAAVGAGTVLALGLVALVAGGRMARPMLAALAGSTGAVLATLAPASVFTAIGADDASRIGVMIACAVVFGAGGVALFRPAMAISGAAAGSIAAAGVLALMTLLGAQMPLQIPGANSPTASIHAVALSDRESLDAARDAAGRAAGEAFARDRIASITGDAAASGQGVVNALADAAQAGWQAIPQQARLTIRVGLLAGAVIGLVFGALWPRRAAGAVASLLGAAGVVAASLALGVVAGVGGAWSASDVACGSLVAWLALAMLGALIQSRRSGASAAVPQPA